MNKMVFENFLHLCDLINDIEPFGEIYIYKNDYYITILNSIHTIRPNLHIEEFIIKCDIDDIYNYIENIKDLSKIFKILLEKNDDYYFIRKSIYDFSNYNNLTLNEIFHMKDIYPIDVIEYDIKFKILNKLISLKDIGNIFNDRNEMIIKNKDKLDKILKYKPCSRELIIEQQFILEF